MASFAEGYKIVRKIGGNIAFLLAIGLYCLTKCISRSELASIGIIPTLLPILTNIAFVALCCKIVLLTAYRPIEVVIVVAIILVALQTCYMSGDDSFFIFSLFIVSAKGVNARMIGILALCVLGFCLALVIVLCLAGVLENNATPGVNQILGGIEVTRQRLGFVHENTIGQIVLALFLCYCLLRYKKFGLVDVLVWFAVAAVLFFVISTKTAAFIIAFGVVLVLISKLIGLKPSLILCVVLGCLSALAGICLGFIYDPDNSLLTSLNSFLAGRLSYAHIFLEEYPVLPFGQELELINNVQAANLGVSAWILDNGYIKLLLGYGLFSLIIALFAYGFSFRQAIKKSSVVLAIVLVLALIDGNCETWFFGLVGIVALSMALGEQASPKGKTLEDGERVESEDVILPDEERVEPEGKTLQDEEQVLPEDELLPDGEQIEPEDEPLQDEGQIEPETKLLPDEERAIPEDVTLPKKAANLDVPAQTPDNGYIAPLLGYGMLSLIPAVFTHGFPFKQAMKKGGVALAIAIVLALLDKAQAASKDKSLPDGEQPDLEDKSLPDGEQPDLEDKSLSEKSSEEQP